MESIANVHLGIACPMANEGPDAVPFVEQALAQCQGFASATFFAVFDKANRDDSMDRLRELAAKEPRLQVVWAPENRCVVDAYIRGYREAIAANCDWILEIDAGFSHKPADMPALFAAMATGKYDCVFGSRFMAGGSVADSTLKRTIVSRGGTMLTNLLVGTRQTDMTSGFELFGRKALEMVLERGIRSRAHFFQTEIKTFCRNLRWIEVPIHYSSPSPRLGSSAITESFRQLGALRKRVRSGEV